MKPPTLSSQRREIERLKARIAVLEDHLDKHSAVAREHIYDVVDAQMKIKQAIEILSGEDA